MPAKTAARDPGAAPSPRRRRTAEEARRRILEAAQKRLVADGPDGLRLQELARDLGISHPAILHHFGSREGLLTALAAHGVRGLNEELARRIAAGPVDLREVLDLTREVLADGGQARLLAWLLLSGRRGSGDGPQVLGELAQVSHAARLARRDPAAGPEPPYEDTVFAIVLVGLALFGDALAGDLIRASAGVEGPDGGARFRDWLAGLLEAHFSGASSPEGPR
jgi:AcrR family transcriptional regulator